MRRSAPPPAPRGTLEVDWPFFGELCRALALRVAREYQPEVVLGVAKAGVIPGVVVASILQCDFASMVVTRKGTDRDPTLLAGPPQTIRGRRILVVDETCDTGSTMRLALNEVRALRPSEVKSAVSVETGDYAPDFYAFETENFIILPWDREIIQGGELIVRPDYAARMEGPPALLQRQQPPDLQLFQVTMVQMIWGANSPPPGVTSVLYPVVSKIHRARETPGCF